MSNGPEKSKGSLKEWERDHYEALNSQLEALKEEYFPANNFVPM